MPGCILGTCMPHDVDADTLPVLRCMLAQPLYYPPVLCERFMEVLFVNGVIDFPEMCFSIHRLVQHAL